MDCVVVERSRPIYEPQFQGFAGGPPVGQLRQLAKVEPVACTRSLGLLCFPRYSRKIQLRIFCFPYFISANLPIRPHSRSG